MRRGAASAAMRRAVADGAAPTEAVRHHARPGAGAGEMLAQWQDLVAQAAGPGTALAPLLRSSDVTDVLVNSTQVWVDRGDGLRREPVEVGSESDARRLAMHMAAACGRRLDEASPIVDGTLPDGTRLHAVLPPLSADGTLISLRTSRPRAFGLDELVRVGTVAPALAPVLRALMSRRASTLVSGSTGSGKTTLLAALLGLVSPLERIVCIEEVTELRPEHPHVVHLQERRPNVQGAGAVTLTDLVRAAVRMRPDRIVLGECRGPEVRDVLAALNTGHEGGWATVHANAVEDVPARLVSLGTLAGLSREALAAQVAAAFEAVIQVRRDAGAQRAPAVRAGANGGSHRRPDGPSAGRRVSEIGVFERDGDTLRCSVAVRIAPDGSLERTGAWPRLASRLGLA